jgi:hypothetical protein
MLRFAGFVSVLVALFAVRGMPEELLPDGYGMIGGVVSEVDENPIEDAIIAAYEVETTIEIDVDTTDAYGRYSLIIPMDGQEAVTVDVHAEKSTYIPADSTGRIVGFLEVDTLNIGLRKEAQPIRGWITELEFDGGIESVYVSGGDPEIGTYSNAEGGYILRLYEPGEYSISFEHCDFRDSVVQVEIDTSSYPLPPVYQNMEMEQVIWNVSVDGDDVAGRGTRINPFASIKRALDYTSIDDTALVWPGLYTGGGNTEMNIDNLQLTIKSAFGPESTFIACTGYPTQERAFFFTNVGPFMAVDGFTIMYGYNSLGGGIACFQNGSPTLTNLILRQNRASQFGGALSIDEDSHPVVRNSILENNQAAHGGALSIRSESSVIMDSCVIISNLAATGNGGGIYLRDSYGLMMNSTVAQNSLGLDGDGAGIYIRDSVEPSLEIYRSVFWYNYPDAIYTLNANPIVEYSDIQGDPVWPGLGNINEHPLFCDPDIGDLHLGVNSPCNDYPGDGEYIGALGPECDSVAVIYGVVSESGTSTPIPDAIVEATCYNHPLKTTVTADDGYYELVIISGCTDTADVEFSHPAYQDTVVDSTVFVMGYSNELNVAMVAGGCDYIPGDCNHNGSTLELNDVTTMIGTYRGTLPAQFECTCPPNGEYFQATADPNGNCIANELSDVTTEIAAYRGTATVSGCEDCPGASGLLSEDQNERGPLPVQHAKERNKKKDPSN